PHAPRGLHPLAAVHLELLAYHSDHHGITVSAGRRLAAASAPSPAGGAGERAGDRLDAVALHDVTHLDVVEAGDVQAALEALTHLAHVVLEALEATELAVVDLHAIAHDAYAAAPVHDAFRHVAAGHGADARDAEELPHLGGAQEHFLLLRREHALEGRPHILDRLVNDAVEADVHALARRDGAGVGVRPDVEADDDRAGRRRQQHVGLVDRADTPVDHLDLHLVGRELLQRVGQRLHRAVHVALDHQVQPRGLPLREHLPDVRQLDAAALDAELLLALQALARLRDLRRAVRVHDQQRVTGLRHARQAEDLRRDARPRLLDVVAPLVQERAHAAVVQPAHERVTHAQRAVGHEHGRDRALPHVQLRLDHRTLCRTG